MTDTMVQKPWYRYYGVDTIVHRDATLVVMLLYNMYEFVNLLFIQHSYRTLFIVWPALLKSYKGYFFTCELFFTKYKHG